MTQRLFYKLGQAMASFFRGMLSALLGCEKPGRAVRLSISVGHPTEQETTMAIMTSTQQVLIGPVQGVDRRGNVAPVENVTFESSDPSILAIHPDPSGDPAVCLVKAVGPVGSAQIVVNADARIGEGEVPTQTGILQIDVLAAEASTLNVPAGQPTEQEF